LAIQHFGPEVGIAISTASMTVIVVLLTEIIPKAIAAKNPKRIANFVALPIYVIHKLLFPLHLFFDKVIDPIVTRIAGTSGDENLDSTEEIMRIAHRARFQKNEGTPIPIIAGAAAAAGMTVRDIMVPRTEIFSVSSDTKMSDILDSMLKENYTRALVYEKSLDDVVGLVHLRDIINMVRSARNDIREVLKPIIRVPERKPILKLLADMQRGFVHMAVVKDEFGVTLGIVTQEDILEEIVGEIRDEFDKDELLAVKQLPEGGYECLGRVALLDFNRETGWDLLGERGDTVGGLVFNLLGRAPHIGDEVLLEGYRISVLDVSGTRITRTRITKEGLDSVEKN
jgi:CBS domain containing-hemolysin-like protein